MTPESIKENLKLLREDHKLTQQDMADKLGISRTSYRNLETGKVKLVSDYFWQISQITGVSVEECLLGYSPITETDTLHEKEVWEEKFKQQADYYEERISQLMRTLEIKESAIRTLESINNRLESQLDKQS